jgi:hypothetical protein
MAEQPRPDDLAQLRAALAAQQIRVANLHAEVTRLQRRRRIPRRSLPLALVALLVALLPLSLLAATPFNDLTGGVHDANIEAIYNAGITRGCDPNVSYCPTDLVTREEMASFLARTAGLGDNPPVANALTAQTATSATTATTATQASNADTVGGYAPSALNRIAFSATELASTLPNDNLVRDVAQVTLTIPGPAAQAVYVRGAFGTAGSGSGGNINIAVRQDGAANNLGSGGLFVPNLIGNKNFGAVSIEWVFVATPGTHTYTLVAYADQTPSDIGVINPRLSATTHPFGGNGAAGATAIDPAP